MYIVSRLCYYQVANNLGNPSVTFYTTFVVPSDVKDILTVHILDLFTGKYTYKFTNGKTLFVFVRHVGQ